MMFRSPKKAIRYLRRRRLLSRTEARSLRRLLKKGGRVEKSDPLYRPMGALYLLLTPPRNRLQI